MIEGIGIVGFIALVVIGILTSNKKKNEDIEIK